MKSKTRMSNRFLSIVLCVAMLIGFVPLSMLSANAATVGIERFVDADTLDNWRTYFLSSDITTENAGGIWTDKSVLTSGFSGIPFNDKGDNFLVALSAIGSNMTISGQSNVPTDTMLVLDVSGSMNDNSGNNNVASQLTDAANATIKTLLEGNKNSRVGVIMYANDATTVLPLGRYTTGNDGKFLTYTSVGEYQWVGFSREWVTTETISLDTDVVYEGTTTKPAAASREVVGGTYIQTGTKLAIDTFISQTSTTVEDPTHGTVKRKPVMVLLSDGAPTYGATSFTDNANRNLGSGNGSSAALAFVTQLSASYAKTQIEAHYENAPLFYTLGVGIDSIGGTDGNIADYVLNPNKDTNNEAANAIREFWKQYNAATVGSEILVAGQLDENSERTVTKISGATLEQYYVNKYFNTANYGTDLQTAIGDAFKAITNDIELQTKYFPTLTTTNENLSGYVSFVDNIGKYMEVTEIKGILINNILYSGADLSSNFVSGGGSLGTMENYLPLGDEFVRAVVSHIGTPDVDTARALIQLAYDYGQLSYTNSTTFSNYIGWCADANGDFLGFWHDAMPASEYPAGTVYLNKSYSYLGAVDAAHGVAKSDMMYAIVQVRKNATTGEETVIFGIPAALLPTVTYDVDLDKDGNLIGLKTSGATEPMRLVYEVALKDEINKYTLTDVIDSTYYNQNKNSDGSVNFYANQFDSTVGYNSVNTYSYFRPSRDNDRYYYQTSSPVYTDDKGTLYEGDAQPNLSMGKMYHAYSIYKNVNGQLSVETKYHELTAESLATSTKSGNNWYVKAGNIRRDYVNYTLPKNTNTTGTLAYIAAPYQDIYGHNVDDTNHMFVVGAIHGNNGKIVYMPETGIKLSKIMAAGSADPDKAFDFVITDISGTASGNYSAYHINASGASQPSTVTFTNGVATVSIKAGETLYIGGLTAGTDYKVAETETDEYLAESVNGSAGNSIILRPQAGNFSSAAFVNAERGTGNFTLTKEVTHPFATDPASLATKTFEIEVTLTLNGNALSARTYKAVHTNDSNVENITTDANGQFKVTLKHDDHFEVYGIPAGTEIKVVESNPGAGFTASYFDSGVAGDGKVTVIDENTVSVIVLNKYTPNRVYPVNIDLSGTKRLEGRDWLDTDEFSFVLEQYNFDNATWTQIGTEQKVTKSDAPTYGFDFNAYFGSQGSISFDAPGTYVYRVREAAGTLPGVTYDTTLHSFVVTVADDDMNGQLEIKSVEPSRDSNTHVTFANNTYTVTTDFTNHYAAGEASATVSIKKTVKNERESPLATLDGFKFEVYEYDPSTQTLEALVATSLPTSATGTTRIILPAFKGTASVGTYYYAVKEVDTGKVGWTYSDKIIPITVEVSDDGQGNLVAIAYTTSATGATSVVNLSFENTYVPKNAELEIDFVTKVLNGRDQTAGEFEFVITEHGQTAGIKGTNGADGKVTFDTALTFNKVGIYYYDITEVKGSAPGVTYDETPFRVTVTVTDDNGELKASYSIVNAVEAEFVNKYQVKSIDNAIEGVKELDGRTLLGDEFTFVLTEALDENGNTAVGAKTYTAKNRSDKTFKFDSITYTKAGTYYYTVHEQIPATPVKGVKYDTNKYVVKVVIAEKDATLSVDSVTYAGLNGETTLKFVNEFTLEPASAVITGNKIFENGTLSGNDFTFKLYESDAAWTEKGEIGTAYNSANGSFSFSALSLGEIKTYYYLVKEVNDNKGGVSYDTTVYRVKIDVTEGMEGKLVAGISVFDGNGFPTTGIVFNNKYSVNANKTLILDGTKTLVGKTLVDGMFEFEFYQVLDSSFTVVGSPMQTRRNASGKFEFSIEYDSGDIGKTFYYVAREKNAGQTVNGIKYSSTKYEITVEVRDGGNGTIQTVTTIYNGTNYTGSIDFVNVYAPTAGSFNLSGNKVLIGDRDMQIGEFDFDLFSADKDFVFGETPILTAKNDKDGNFSFENITLGNAGTYYFVLKENKGTIPGIIYDEAVYNITVKVNDDGKGTLTVEDVSMVKVTKDSSEKVTVITFTNTYKAADTSITLSGNKVLIGRDLVADEFAFIMSPANEKFEIDADAKALKALNAADGSFGFETLTFTKAGTYYYVISEDTTVKADRVTFDNTKYYVTVTVTNNEKEGKLVATYEIVSSATNAKAENVTFTNVYTPKPADITVDISVNKKVENKGSELITAEGFEFLLEKLGTEEKQSAKSDVNGIAGFTLSFTEDDIGKTYTYKLTEVNDGRANVTYSTAEYVIKVTVSLTADNKLSASITQNDVAVEKVSAEFVNEYDYTPDIPDIPDDPDIPNTGDGIFGSIWLTLVLVCGAFVVTYFFSKKKRQRA